MKFDQKRIKNMFSKNPQVMIAAEVSANHGQSFDRAIQMIDLAKDAGCDSVKFQTYTPDTITLDADNKYFQIDHPEWGGQTLHQLYQKGYTPWEWFKDLKKHCDKRGITFFSTVFDKTSVDFLEGLDVAVHKIASFELVDIPLIEYVAKTKKPLIISTGMATEEEISEAVYAARSNGVKDLLLLKCVSSYPADPKDMHLRSMKAMQEKFKCPVGLSDHTLGIEVPIAAVSLGAVFIEKHFVVNKRNKTPDSFFSITADDFAHLVKNVRVIEDALGSTVTKISDAQKKSRVFRKSIFVSKDIKKGEAFNEDNIRVVRPGNGLKPKHFNEVLGKKAKRNLAKGTPVSWSMINK